MKLLIRAFSQNAAPGLVIKELTHARSSARRSTHSIAILAKLDRLVYHDIWYRLPNRTIEPLLVLLVSLLIAFHQTAPRVLGGDLLLQPIVNAHKRPSDAASVLDCAIPASPLWLIWLNLLMIETLFKRIIYNSNYVLYQLFPLPSTTVHKLRPSRHNRTLQDKQTSIIMFISL